MVRTKLLVGRALLVALLVSCGCRRTPPETQSDAATNDSPAAENVGQKLDATIATFAPNTKRVDVFHGEAMKEDEVQTFGANLLVDTCYWLIGAGESSIDELVITLYDPSGERVDASKKTMRPMLHLCPSKPGRYTFKVAVPRGKGNYQVALHSKP